MKARYNMRLIDPPTANKRTAHRTPFVMLYNNAIIMNNDMQNWSPYRKVLTYRIAQYRVSNIKLSISYYYISTTIEIAYIPGIIS